MRERLAGIFYWANVRSWVRLILLWSTSRDIQGRANVPRRGAFILASNHFSVGDPPIITGTLPRRIAWMTKEELFHVPLLGILYRLFGCVPVRRFEADLKALRLSQDVLRRGRVLGMFPEGTRSGGKGLTRGEPGTALIALRSGVPVVPVAIWGTENVKLPRDFFRRTRVHLRFGEPFTLPRRPRLAKEDVERGTEAIMKSIAQLLPPQFRGVYADIAPQQRAATKGKK